MTMLRPFLAKLRKMKIITTHISENCADTTGTLTSSTFCPIFILNMMFRWSDCPRYPRWSMADSAYVAYCADFPVVGRKHSNKNTRVPIMPFQVEWIAHATIQSMRQYLNSFNSARQLPMNLLPGNKANNDRCTGYVEWACWWFDR